MGVVLIAKSLAPPFFPVEQQGSGSAFREFRENGERGGLGGDGFSEELLLLRLYRRSCFHFNALFAHFHLPLYLFWLFKLRFLENVLEAIISSSIRIVHRFRKIFCPERTFHVRSKLRGIELNSKKKKKRTERDAARDATQNKFNR